jgi:hypothetical protein
MISCKGAIYVGQLAKELRSTFGGTRTSGTGVSNSFPKGTGNCSLGRPGESKRAKIRPLVILNTSLLGVELDFGIQGPAVAERNI